MSLLSDFEKAEDQLVLAIGKKNEQDLQSYIITLNFMIENYIRWMESLLSKGDHKKLLLVLKKTIDLIKEIINIDPNNRFILSQKRKVSRLINQSIDETKENTKMNKKLGDLHKLL